MLLKDKNAVIYGGGGLTRGVALAFARAGARVFLAGRNREKLQAISAEVAAAGGQAESALVDALDEQAVNEHAAQVVAKAGSLDISFNLISHGHMQGLPLVEMTTADLSRAVNNSLLTNFITARAAARYMTPQGAGAILMLTSGSSYGAMAGMGSTPPADAATEALMRSLAAELGPSGIRVVGMWTAAVAETLTPESIAAVNSNMVMDSAQVQALIGQVAQMTMLRRAPALVQVANAAVFLASDMAAGITGTILNVTCGLVPH